MSLVSCLAWCQIESPEAVSVFIVLKANITVLNLALTAQSLIQCHVRPQILIVCAVWFEWSAIVIVSIKTDIRFTEFEWSEYERIACIASIEFLICHHGVKQVFWKLTLEQMIFNL